MTFWDQPDPSIKRIRLQVDSHKDDYQTAWTQQKLAVEKRRFFGFSLTPGEYSFNIITEDLVNIYKQTNGKHNYMKERKN